jgi:hypothetical protein
MRVHLVWSVCQYRSLYGPRDTDLLRHIAVQHHILIPLSLIVVLPVVSSAVFLSVGPSPIAVGFGLSIELLRRGFSFPHGGGGGRWKGEKGEEVGKHA